MTYNILEGGVGRIDPLAEVIRLAGPDVIVLQETTDEGHFHRLADRLGMDRFLAINPRDREGATGLLARWEIREATNLAAVDRRLTRSALQAVLRGPERGEIAVLGLHLHARETEADEAVRFTELPAILEAAARLGPRHVIAGDFNTSHPDQVIDLAKLRPGSRGRIAGQGNRLPRDVIGRMLEAGFADAHSIGRKPAEFDTSLTTSSPAMRVDFVFVPQAMATQVKRCEVFKPEMARYASDHFPVVAEIELI